MSLPPGATVRIIGVGGSAGGQSAITEIVQRLPTGLDAAVLVTVHLRTNVPTNLPNILDRASRLRVTAAEDGQVLAPGTVLVAPPDRHLCVSDGQVWLDAGPKVNSNRPAVDPMFMSIAHHAGPQAAGIVVSGALDDGARGLRAIAAAGGYTLVQDPETAPYPGMPLAALDRTNVDVIDAPAGLARAVARWVQQPVPLAPPRDEVTTVATSDERLSAMAAAGEHGPMLTCPLCHGVLVERDESGQPVFACRIGHVFNPLSLLAANGDDLETTLMIAARTLSERAHLLQRMADEAFARGFRTTGEKYLEQADAMRGHADTLAALLDGIAPPVSPTTGPSDVRT